MNPKTKKYIKIAVVVAVVGGLGYLAWKKWFQSPPGFVGPANPNPQSRMPNQTASSIRAGSGTASHPIFDAPLNLPDFTPGGG